MNNEFKKIILLASIIAYTQMDASPNSVISLKQAGQRVLDRYASIKEDVKQLAQSNDTPQALKELSSYMSDGEAGKAVLEDPVGCCNSSIGIWGTTSMIAIVKTKVEMILRNKSFCLNHPALTYAFNELLNTLEGFKLISHQYIASI